MRLTLPVLSALALAACQPTVVERQQGVGFQNYSLYQQQQDYLSRTRVPGPMPAEPMISTETAARAPVTYAAAPGTPQSVAADTMAALNAGRPVQTVESPPLGSPLPAPAPVAVAAAAAPAPMPAAIEPVAFSGSNIVAFALATNHPVGQPVYRRSALRASGRSGKACLGYASDGLAQEAFLKKGGPARDPLGLDPDGDGYACRWNPAPFRAVRN